MNFFWLSAAIHRVLRILGSYLLVNAVSCERNKEQTGERYSRQSLESKRNKTLKTYHY
jgi:hypothetical protein